MNKTRTIQMENKALLAQAGAPLTNVISASRFTDFKIKLTKVLNAKNIEKELETLCQKENKSLRKQYDALTTLRRYYTYYRNICREMVPQELLTVCFSILNLTRDEMLSLKEQYAQKVSKEHRSLRPLSNPDQMILTALELLDRVSVYDRILGLAFLTGRRSAEIACTATFQDLKQKNAKQDVKKDWIIFDGQLKVKEKVTAGPYEIPLLASPSLIVEGITRLRKEKPQWVDQPILFHDRGAPSLSLRVKRHFSDFIENPTVKDLRAAYAEVCYREFGNVTIAKSRFFSDILGHGENDNLTGQSYLDFYIKE